MTTIIWALPLGYFLTGQKVSWRQGEGAAIIVLGLAIFTVIGDPAGGVDSAPGSEWLAAVIVIGASCVALCLFANRGGLTVKAAVLGTVAGILFGLSATLMKPVVESLHSEGWGVFGDWELWVMAIGGIVGFLVQQVSLATGKLVPSVATVSVANPVVSVILGALILHERLDRAPALALRGRRRRTRRGARGRRCRLGGARAGRPGRGHGRAAVARLSELFLAAGVDRDRQVEEAVVVDIAERCDLAVAMFDQGLRPRRRLEQQSLDLADALGGRERGAHVLSEAPAAQVPPVELAQPADGALGTELAAHLADEAHDLG